jgi:signal transduction histidine kinase
VVAAASPAVLLALSVSPLPRWLQVTVACMALLGTVILVVGACVALRQVASLREHDRLTRSRLEKEARVRAIASERSALEAQVQRSQRMDGFGRLAGGIAHHFNNLLTAILGHADLLDESLAGQPAQGDVREIARAASRAADLTRQLAAFANRQPGAPRRVAVASVVREMERMLCRLLGEHIELAIRVDPDTWPIRADPTQFEQVILNLATNARDAMPRGGVLRIEAANAVVDADAALRIGAPPGEYAKLGVSDTGVGMDEDTLARVFEPFFTTKAEGRGTGLGLSTVYGIVRQSAGHIMASSQPGAGTVFDVYFPRLVPENPPESGPDLPAT